MIPPTRRILLENHSFYYPFRNTTAYNVLEDVTINPSEDDTTIKVLLLGCGDLRNLFQTASSTKTACNLEIHLNDVSPPIMARNILIAKVILDPKFDINIQSNMNFIWDIWYNATWSESTRERFTSQLDELLNDELPENIVIPKDSYLDSLKKTWSEWQSLLSPQNSASMPSIMKKMTANRREFIFKNWNRFLVMATEDHFTPSFSEAVFDMYDFHLKEILLSEYLPERRRRNIDKEVVSYFEQGNCYNKTTNNVCVNPTLLEPVTLRWNVHYTLCPFDGYRPLPLEALDLGGKDGIILRACQNRLKQEILSFQKRKNLKIFFHVGDALELCYAGTNENFDVINCSNLPDYVGLANLLNAGSLRLSNDPNAVMITESMLWSSMSPTLIRYVEESLCAPLSMIPTMYGLRLATHVELGASKPSYTGTFMAPSATLCWQKARNYENIKIDFSLSLERCLDRLEMICSGRRWTGELSGMLCYTPRTFNYIANSIVRRLNGHCEWIDERKSKLSSSFDLALRTTETWRKGGTVLKFTAVIDCRKKSAMNGTPALRLLLIPASKYFEFTKAPSKLNSLLGIDYIDNIDLKLEKNSENEVSFMKVSFLLVADHGLEGSTMGVIVDIASQLPFVHFKFSEAIFEKFEEPHPFAYFLNGNSDPSLQASCLEFEDHYELDIKIDDTEGYLSGLKVEFMDHCPPCQSAHTLKVSLTEPRDLKPLILSLAYPVYVDSLKATVDRSVKLLLTKATREPWPCEFNNSKWKVEDCAKWNDDKLPDRAQIPGHLGMQFTLSRMLEYNRVHTNELDSVREIINSIYNFVNQGFNYIKIVMRGSETSPDWFIRTHLPFRVSPLGIPLLVLTAVDHRLLEKLEVDFRNVFPSPVLATVVMSSEEEAELFRYLLRLNSSKMLPILWQKKNVPLDRNPAWLATFLSPLYLEKVLVDDEKKNGELPFDIDAKNVCAHCDKAAGGLKRCSRCKKVAYCDATCQRADWAQHKIVCSV